MEEEEEEGENTACNVISTTTCTSIKRQTLNISQPTVAVVVAAAVAVARLTVESEEAYLGRTCIKAGSTLCKAINTTHKTISLSLLPKNCPTSAARFVH